jgi:hypothetical protein
MPSVRIHSISASSSRSFKLMHTHTHTHPPTHPPTHPHTHQKALDACVKLAQLGRLVYAPRPSNRGGGGGGGRGGRGGGGGPTRSEAKRGPQFAGDVSAVPLCSSREQLDELCRIAQTLVEVCLSLVRLC